MKKLAAFALAIYACTACSTAVHAAQTYQAYKVTVDTSSLIGNPNSPYYIDLQLNSGGGPFANQAYAFNFTYGGGSASASSSAVVYNGNPTGDLSTGIALSTATSAFNEIAQQFTAGTTLTFDVLLTENGGVHAPDGFSFAIDDGTTFQIPTTDPNGGLTLATWDINLAFTNPAISVATYLPTDPQYQGPNGITVSVVAVPEPSVWAFGLLGFGFLVYLNRRRSLRA